MKKYNRNNCDNRLRAVITDKWGRTVALFGKHAFEYEIVIQDRDRITITTFKTGREARKVFNTHKLKK